MSPVVNYVVKTAQMQKAGRLNTAQRSVDLMGRATQRVMYVISRRCARVLGIAIVLASSAPTSPVLHAQSPGPVVVSGEDWAFPFTPEPAPYSGLFHMGPTVAPSGMVRHIGRTLTWASLNPSENVFDFSYVDDVLTAAEAGNYGVVFRLKSSVYDGAEAGQGGTQSQMIPQWVVDKYNLTDGFIFDTGPNRTYAAPWHPGVQAEFYKLLQQFGQRRLLESPHLLAIYLHGVSTSAGEEMSIGDSTYTDQAAFTAANAGYDGSLYGSPLADAIMDCWTTRMERWAEVTGPYVYKIAWVGAGSWSGITYPQILLNNYALSLGLGARHGFLEHYYNGEVRPPVAGQFYNGAYVTNDWTHALRDGRFWGDENEVANVYRDPFDRDQELGPGEPRDLAYRSSFFRAAQLGMNFLWISNTTIDRAGNNNGDSTDDALPKWFTLVAGKPAAESPDAAVWLREAQVRHLPAPPYTDQEVTQGDPSQPFKNFERLLMQRDIPGAVTQPAYFLNMPHVWHKQMDYNNPNVFGEYTARSTNVGSGQRNIAFKLDPVFRTSLGNTSVKIKVTFLDELGTTWNVQVAKGSNSPVNLGSVTNGTSNAWKTATFTLTTANAPFEPGGAGSPLGEDIDFIVNVPGGSNDLTVRYVRVVRTAEVAIAPRIKVHPISQSIPSGGFATLHVVAEGPAPYTYQWRKNGMAMFDTTQSPLVRYPGDGGGYSVLVENVFGSIISNTAVVTDDTYVAIRVEAESGSLNGFSVVEDGQFSGGARLDGDVTNPTATYTFSGSTGTYDISVGYCDEDDGISSYTLSGSAAGPIASWQGDQPTGEIWCDSPSLLTREIATSATLVQGETITLDCQRGGDEPCRVDFFDFTIAQEIRVEAESGSLNGFSVVEDGQFSGGARLDGDVTNPTATYTFSGSTGTYDISVGYCDEDDGISSYTLSGSAAGPIASWQGDQPTGEIWCDSPSLLTREIATSATLVQGETITLDCQRGGDEPCRVDFFDFTYADPAPD